MIFRFVNRPFHVVGQSQVIMEGRVIRVYLESLEKLLQSLTGLVCGKVYLPPVTQASCLPLPEGPLRSTTAKQPCQSQQENQCSPYMPCSQFLILPKPSAINIKHSTLSNEQKVVSSVESNCHTTFCQSAYQQKFPQKWMDYPSNLYSGASLPLLCK